ncbi:hypothetical protein [Planococcus sp. CAU13]|uniref:hypothetical protein n=1 Tax=Planococcus sp. CAU13 TaxID=1541197 RepID=UPI00052FE5F5|nr:hypothetical protein [Planococcus sp. CAU13]
MNEWKQAYRLAVFELKASRKSLLTIMVFYIAMSLVVMMSFDLYLEERFMLFDLLFLAIFFLFPAWMKSKEFQMQKMDGDLWTVPSVVMLQQLPVSRDVIIKSRFVIHAVCSFPLQFILLAAMPLMSENFREGMSPLAYIAFVLIWLALSIAVGFMMAASEAGGNYKTSAIVKSFIYMLAGIAILYALLFLFADGGFIRWTMVLAADWTWLSIVAAAVIGIAGWNYWQADMRKLIRKTDYL